MDTKRPQHGYQHHAAEGRCRWITSCCCCSMVRVNLQKKNPKCEGKDEAVTPCSASLHTVYRKVGHKDPSDLSLIVFIKDISPKD